MNKLKKVMALLLSICLIALAIPSEAFAASASVSVSSTSGKVGSSVTVTCTIKASGTDVGAADVTLQYDTSGLKLNSCSGGASGGSGSIQYSNAASAAGSSTLSFSATFTIQKEGSFSVRVTSADVYSWNDEPLSASKSGGSITGKAETTSGGNTSGGNTSGGNTSSGDTSGGNSSGGNSSGGSTSGGSTSDGNSSGSGSTGTKPEDKKDNNSQLKSLDVYPGTLSPAFSAGTRNYTVKTTSDVTEVTITASAASSKAKVNVSGGKDLKLGDNAAKVVVTAEDGTVTVYNLTIVCEKIEKITIDNKEHTISEGFGDEQIPAGFKRTKVTYNGREYEGLTNEKGNITLINLQNGETAKYYIYNAAENSFTDFILVEVAEGKFIYIMPLDETDFRFATKEKTTHTVGEFQVDAWKMNDEFCVVSALDMNGEEVWYQYDSVDGTYQRYAEMEKTPVEEVPEEPTEEKTVIDEYYLYIIIGLAALVVILLVVVIVLAVTRKTRRGRGKARERRKGKQTIEIDEDDE